MEAAVSEEALEAPPARAYGDRPWQVVFVALMILECAPFWIYRYFPSQDGPSHLHNAVTLANYQSEPIYRQYYSVTPFRPAGNLLIQYFLVALLKVAEPRLAQSLLLSAYVILLFLSLRYLLIAVTPNAWQFALFAGVLAPNWFLYMGYWNFLFSVPLLLFVIGYYLRQQRWTPARIAWLTILGLGLYLTHAVSWVVCVVSVGVLGLWPLLPALLRRYPVPSRQAIWSAVVRYAVLVGALLPAAIPMLAYLTSSREPAICGYAPMRSRLWDLYTLSFLRTLVRFDGMILEKAVVVTLLLSLSLVVGLAVRRKQFDSANTKILAVSAALGAIAIFGPDCIGVGGNIRKRLGMFACLFFVVWLAGASTVWPRAAVNIVAVLFCAITAGVSLASAPVLAEWNGRLSEVVRAGQNIRPGSTVMLLNLVRPAGVNPYLHAVGLLSGRAIVDILNYETSVEFPAWFRPERSPYPALGTRQQLGAISPVFDAVRYERETQGRLDYLLIVEYAAVGGRSTLADRVDGLYHDQLRSFTLVPKAAGQSEHIRLYERAEPVSP